MTCTTIKNIWDCGKNCGVSSPYLLYRTTQGSKSTAGVFALEEDGLYFRSDPADLSQKGLWLSSPIEVVAQTRDPLNGSWGRLVRFHDANGVLHQLILSMAELGGEWRQCATDAVGTGTSNFTGQDGSESSHPFSERFSSTDVRKDGQKIRMDRGCVCPQEHSLWRSRRRAFHPRGPTAIGYF